MMFRLIQSLCLALAGLFLLLISVATLCASSHDLVPAHNHSHSQNNFSHSLLCSWACQASSKVNAADSTQGVLLVFLLVFSGKLFRLFTIPTQAFPIALSTRGPPQ